MNGALIRKSILEARWLWLALACTLFIFCWVHVIITSNVDMGRFMTILDNIPEAWEKLAPVPFKKLMTYPARIAVIYEEPMLYLLMTVWCVSRSSDVVSGELGRGTMEMLLAQPVSRLQTMLAPVLITVIGIAGLAVVAYAGTCAGIASTTVERPSPNDSWTIPFTAIQFSVNNETETIPMRVLAGYHLYVPAALNYFCLGFFMAGICTLLSALDRYRWRTIGIMVGFYVLSVLAEILGQSTELFAWAKNLSFFSAYEPISFVAETVAEPTIAWSWMMRDSAGEYLGWGPLACDALLLGMGLAGFLIAARIFTRRDLPAPL